MSDVNVCGRWRGMNDIYFHDIAVFLYLQYHTRHKSMRFPRMCTDGEEGNMMIYEGEGWMEGEVDVKM